MPDAAVGVEGDGAGDPAGGVAAEEWAVGMGTDVFRQVGVDAVQLLAGGGLVGIVRDDGDVGDLQQFNMVGDGWRRLLGGQGWPFVALPLRRRPDGLLVDGMKDAAVLESDAENGVSVALPGEGVGDGVAVLGYGKTP